MKSKKVLLSISLLMSIAFNLVGAITSVADVLIVSPHPDDDVLMASGVIYRALQNAEIVKVVYMTNGDYGGLDDGNLRQGEAVDSQSRLGMGEDDLIFLGYPDGALGEIRNSYPLETDVYVSTHGQSETYGSRGLGRSDYHSYRFNLTAPYNGANIVLDLKTILTDFLPDHIFTTSEYDAASDHRETYTFLKLALEQSCAENPDYHPTVHKTIIWANNSYEWPNEYNPGTYLSDTINLSSTSLLWSERESLDVPVVMQSEFYAGNPKYLAITEHYSQDGASSFLGRFIHKDEIFWTEAATGSNQPPIVSAGLDQNVDEGGLVQLDASGSIDKDGDPISYAWRQVEGTTVALSDINSATPTFTAPAGLASDELLSFELVVSDAQYSSYADAVNVVVQSSSATTIPYTDITTNITVVTASTTHAISDASNVVDGCIDGYPNDATCEWISNGEDAGAWIELSWDNPVYIGKVNLYDRINLDDQILQGEIIFSDGTSLQTGLLDNSGRPGEYIFNPRQITGMRFNVASVSSDTSNVGLAEITVFSANLTPVALATATSMVSQGDLVTLDGSASRDPNGDTLSYTWSQTGGQAVVLSDTQSAAPTFVAPTGAADDEILSFELIVNDGELSSDPAVIHVIVEATASSEENEDDQTPGTSTSGGGSGGCFIGSLSIRQ